MWRIGFVVACLLLASCEGDAPRSSSTSEGLFVAPTTRDHECKAAARFQGTWTGAYSLTLSDAALTPTAGAVVAVEGGIVQAVDVTAKRDGTVEYALSSANGEVGTCTGTADRWTATTTCTIDAFVTYDFTNPLPMPPDYQALPLARPACTQTVTRVDRLDFGREPTMTSTWTGTVAGDACPYKGATIAGLGTFVRSAPPPDTSGIFLGVVKNLTTLASGTKTAGTGATTMRVVQAGSHVVTDAYNAANKRWTHCSGPQVGDVTYKWCSVGAPTLGAGCVYEGLNVGTLDPGATPVTSYNVYHTVYNGLCGPTFSGAKVDVVIFNTLQP